MKLTSVFKKSNTLALTVIYILFIYCRLVLDETEEHTDSGAKSVRESQRRSEHRKECALLARPAHCDIQHNFYNFHLGLFTPLLPATTKYKLLHQEKYNEIVNVNYIKHNRFFLNDINHENIALTK